MATHREFECSRCGKIKGEIPFDDEEEGLYCQSCTEPHDMTNAEFKAAVELHAEFINCLCNHPPKDIMEVLAHSMASLVDQLGMCCHRGLLEFPSGEKWVVAVSSHEAEIKAAESGPDEVVH